VGYPSKLGGATHLLKLAPETVFLLLMTTYQLQVSIDPDTLTQLTKSGYTLYGFLAAQVSDTQALPLLWYASDLYSSHTVIEWTDQYAVYTSVSTLTSGQSVNVGMSIAMSAGQLLTIGAGGGSSKLTSNGIPDYFAVLNTSTTSQICGLMAGDTASAARPFCALPLNGGSAQVFKPLPHLLLLFSTAICAPATALTQWQQSSGPAMLVDLSSAVQPAVSYNLSTGWSWGENIWGKSVPFGTNLATLLLTQPPALVANLLALLSFKAD
jgi:hypothetical protein